MAKSGPIRRYLVTVLIVAIAAAVRAAMGYLLGATAPFVTFYPAVILAALIVGKLGPALLAVALSTLAADYLFMRPIGSLWVETPGDLASLIFFVLSGVVLAVIARRLAAAESDRVRKESKDLFRTTVNSISDAVITADNWGNVRLLNPVAEKLTGWSQREAVEQPLEDIFAIVNEITRARAENPTNRMLREGYPVKRANDTCLLRRYGGEIPIEYSAAPIKDVDGDVTGVVIVFHDVTDKRRTEKTPIN